MKIGGTPECSVINQHNVPVTKFLQGHSDALGICLGAQLISKALGGEVMPAEIPEIGWYEVE